MRPKILLPFDRSPAAQQAVAWAAELQRTTGAETIQMIHAINSRPPGTSDVSLETLLPNADEIGGLEAGMREAAKQQGARASAKVMIRANTIGAIIVEAAHETGADLIVMGTHGRTGVKRLFLGSVAEYVLRHAECPVVTVQDPRVR